MSLSKPENHDITRSLVNKVNGKFLDRLQSLTSDDIIIEDAPSYNQWINLVSKHNIRAQIHFMFSHPIGESSFKFHEDLDTLGFPYTSCSHSKSALPSMCICGGKNWKKGKRVVVLFIETLYHNSYDQNCAEFERVAASKQVNLEFYASVYWPNTFRVDMANITLNASQRSKTDPENVAEVQDQHYASTLLLNVCPNDKYPFPSRLDTLQLLMKGSLKTSSGYVTLEKVSECQKYYFFQIKKSPTKGLAPSNQNNEFYERNRVVVTCYSESEMGVIGSPMKITWFLALLTRQTMDNLQSRLTFDMDCSNFFNRAMQVENGSYVLGLMSLLYYEYLNTHAYINGLYAKKGNVEGPKSITGNLLTKLKHSFIPGNDESEQVIKGMQKYHDFIDNTAGNVKTTLLYAAAGAAIASGALVSLQLPIFAPIYTNLLMSFGKSMVEGWINEDDKKRNIAAHTMKLHIEQFYALCNAPHLYKNWCLRMYKFSPSGEYEQGVALFKNFTDDLRLPSCIMVHAPVNFCLNCTDNDDAVQTTICNDCGGRFCVPCSFAHWCAKNVPIPKKRTCKQLINMQPGPCDIVIAVYSLTIPSKVIPSHGSGHYVKLGSSCYFLGGKNPKPLLFNPTVRCTIISDVKCAYGRGTFYYGQPWKSINKSNSIKNFGNLLNYTCPSHTPGVNSGNIRQTYCSLCISPITGEQIVNDAFLKCCYGFNLYNPPFISSHKEHKLSNDGTCCTLSPVSCDEESVPNKRVFYLRHGIFRSNIILSKSQQSTEHSINQFETYCSERINSIIQKAASMPIFIKDKKAAVQNTIKLLSSEWAQMDSMQEDDEDSDEERKPRVNFPHPNDDLDEALRALVGDENWRPRGFEEMDFADVDPSKSILIATPYPLTRINESVEAPLLDNSEILHEISSDILEIIKDVKFDDIYENVKLGEVVEAHTPFGKFYGVISQVKSLSDLYQIGPSVFCGNKCPSKFDWKNYMSARTMMCSDFTQFDDRIPEFRPYPRAVEAIGFDVKVIPYSGDLDHVRCETEEVSIPIFQEKIVKNWNVNIRALIAERKTLEEPSKQVQDLLSQHEKFGRIIDQRVPLPTLSHKETKKNPKKGKRKGQSYIDELKDELGIGDDDYQDRDDYSIEDSDTDVPRETVEMFEDERLPEDEQRKRDERRQTKNREEYKKMIRKLDDPSEDRNDHEDEDSDTPDDEDSPQDHKRPNRATPGNDDGVKIQDFTKKFKDTLKIRDDLKKPIQKHIDALSWSKRVDEALQVAGYAPEPATYKNYYVGDWTRKFELKFEPLDIKLEPKKLKLHVVNKPFRYQLKTGTWKEFCETHKCPVAHSSSQSYYKEFKFVKRYLEVPCQSPYIFYWEENGNTEYYLAEEDDKVVLVPSEDSILINKIGDVMVELENWEKKEKSKDDLRFQRATESMKQLVKERTQQYSKVVENQLLARLKTSNAEVQEMERWEKSCEGLRQEIAIKEELIKRSPAVVEDGAKVCSELEKQFQISKLSEYVAKNMRAIDGNLLEKSQFASLQLSNAKEQAELIERGLEMQKQQQELEIQKAKDQLEIAHKTSLAQDAANKRMLINQDLARKATNRMRVEELRIQIEHDKKQLQEASLLKFQQEIQINQLAIEQKRLEAERTRLEIIKNAKVESEMESIFSESEREFLKRVATDSLKKERAIEETKVILEHANAIKLVREETERLHLAEQERIQEDLWKNEQESLMKARAQMEVKKLEDQAAQDLKFRETILLMEEERRVAQLKKDKKLQKQLAIKKKRDQFIHVLNEFLMKNLERKQRAFILIEKERIAKKQQEDMDRMVKERIAQRLLEDQEKARKAQELLLRQQKEQEERDRIEKEEEDKKQKAIQDALQKKKDEEAAQLLKKQKEELAQKLKEEELKKEQERKAFEERQIKEEQERLEKLAAAAQEADRIRRENALIEELNRQQKAKEQAIQQEKERMEAEAKNNEEKFLISLKQNFKAQTRLGGPFIPLEDRTALDIEVDWEPRFWMSLDNINRCTHIFKVVCKNEASAERVYNNLYRIGGSAYIPPEEAQKRNEIWDSYPGTRAEWRTYVLLKYNRDIGYVQPAEYEEEVAQFSDTLTSPFTVSRKNPTYLDMRVHLEKMRANFQSSFPNIFRTLVEIATPLVTLIEQKANETVLEEGFQKLVPVLRDATAYLVMRNEVKVDKKKNLEGLNFIEAIIVLYSSMFSPINITIWWIDAPAAAGKSEAWRKYQTKRKTVLITPTRTSLLEGVEQSMTYQKAYQTSPKASIFIDELGRSSLESLSAYCMMLKDGCPEIIGFSDSSQGIGMGNHGAGYTQFEREHVINIPLFLLKNEGTFELKRCHGPGAELIAEILYNRPDCLFQRKYPGVRAIPDSSLAKGTLEIIPYPEPTKDPKDPFSMVRFNIEDNIDVVTIYRKEDIDNQKRKCAKNGIFEITTWKTKDGKDKWAYVYDTKSVMTISQSQGMTVHGRYATYLTYKAKGFWDDWQTVVALTRPTTTLYVNRNVYDALMSFGKCLRGTIQPCILDSPSAKLLNCDIGREEGRDVLRMIDLASTSRMRECKKEQTKEEKYLTLLQNLRSTMTIDAEATVYDATPGTRTLSNIGGQVFHKHIKPLDRNTFNVLIDPATSEWRFLFTITPNPNDLVIIDAPTSHCEPSQQGLEYIDHRALLNWVRKQRFNILFKTQFPQGVGREVLCDKNIYNKFHNPGGCWQKMEWYFLWQPNDSPELIKGSYKSPFAETHSCIELPTVPIQNFDPESLYEMWAADETIVGQDHDQLIFVKCPAEHLSPLSFYPNKNFKQLYATIHMHEEDPSHSEVDKRFMFCNSVYANACHFVLTKPKVVPEGEKEEPLVAKCKCGKKISVQNATNTNIHTVSRTPGKTTIYGKEFPDPPFAKFAGHPEVEHGLVPMITTKKKLVLPLGVRLRQKPRKDRMNKYSHISPLSELNSVAPVNYSNSKKNRLVSFIERLYKSPKVNILVASFLSKLVPYVFSWLYKTNKLPQIGGIFDWTDFDKAFPKFLQKKPAHRKRLYKVFRDSFNKKKARSFSQFVKNEKLEVVEDDEGNPKIPRNICSINVFSQYAGVIADDFFEKWKAARVFTDTNITMTSGMTGEDLANDLYNRPALWDTDFGKYDRSIHYLIKISMLAVTFLLMCFGTGCNYFQSIHIEDYIKEREFSERTHKYMTNFLWIVMNTWWAVAKTDLFVCTLFGKTFSGDWCTLLFNCLLTIFFISFVAFLNGYTNWFARVMGDDSNNNQPEEFMLDTSYILSHLGMELEVQKRDREHQSYNSQILCIDKKGFKFLTPATPGAVAKQIFVPIPASQKNILEISKFQLDVIRNQNYALQFAGDPVLKALRDLSIDKYGIVKKFDPLKYSYIRRDNPYKAANIHTHEISEYSESILAEKVYGMSKKRLRELLANKDYKRLFADYKQFNFRSDKSASLFDTHHDFNEDVVAHTF